MKKGSGLCAAVDFVVADAVADPSSLFFAGLAACASCWRQSLGSGLEEFLC